MAKDKERIPADDNTAGDPDEKLDVEEFLASAAQTGGYTLSVLPCPKDARGVAELQLIAAMIERPDIIPDVIARIKNTPVFKWQHSKHMFSVLVELHNASENINRLTIKARYEERYPDERIDALLIDYAQAIAFEPWTHEGYKDCIKLLHARHLVDEFHEQAVLATTPRKIQHVVEHAIERMTLALDERRPDPVDLDAIAANGIPPVPWLLEGWLTTDDIAILSGGPFAGKSTLCYSLAQAVSTGGDWLGITPAQATRVLVIDEEQGERSAARLMLRLGGANENLRLYSCAGFTAGTPEGARRLELEIADFRPGLVIFDSMSHLLAGIVSENDSMEMAGVFRELHRIRLKYSTALIAIDHRPKWGRLGTPAPSELLDLAVRGSSVKQTQASAVYSMIRNGDTCELQQAKRRESDSLLSIRVGYEAAGPDGRITLTNLGSIEEFRGAEDKAAVFVEGLLEEHGAMTRQAIVEAGNAAGHTKRTIIRAVTVHSKPGGRLERVERGTYRRALGTSLAQTGTSKELF